jgi:hypothetical protein
MVRPALTPTQLLSSGYRGSLIGGKVRPGREAHHSLHLVPRLRMSRSYTSPPWRLHGVAGLLYFYEGWVVSNYMMLKLSLIKM